MAIHCDAHVWVQKQRRSLLEGRWQLTLISTRVSFACQLNVTPCCAQAQPVSDLAGMMNVRVKPVQRHREKMFLLFTFCVAQLSSKWSSVSLTGDSLWLLWHIWTQRDTTGFTTCGLNPAEWPHCPLVQKPTLFSQEDLHWNRDCRNQNQTVRTPCFETGGTRYQYTHSHLQPCVFGKLSSCAAFSMSWESAG